MNYGYNILGFFHSLYLSTTIISLLQNYKQLLDNYYWHCYITIKYKIVEFFYIIYFYHSIIKTGREISTKWNKNMFQIKFHMQF